MVANREAYENLTMDIIPSHDGFTLHVAIRPDYVDEDIGFLDLPVIGFRWASPNEVIPVTILGEPKPGWEWAIVLPSGVCTRREDDIIEAYKDVEHFDDDIRRSVKREKDDWRAKGVKGRDEL